MNEIKEKIKKNERGSITLFVLVAMLFFITILILSYAGQINKMNSQRKQVERIQEEYSVEGDMEEAYQEVLEAMSLQSIIKVGDYVAYTPQNATTSYNFEAKYTGYDTDQTINQDNLKWRVLNVSEDKVELISSTPTSTTIYFKGALGFNNGVYLLNDFCNTLYGNSGKGAIARSLNIEDIEEKMDLNVWDYHDYTRSETNTKYGDTYTYTSNRYYPYQWTQEKTEKSKIDEKTITGNLGKSEQKELTTETLSQASTSIEAQQTYWYRDSLDIKTNFKTANARDNAKTNSMYYELLCNNGSSYYWLASRSVYTNNSSYADFGLRSVISGDVDGFSVFNSSSDTNGDSCFVRPVVSLPSNVINISTQYNEDTGWSLK